MARGQIELIKLLNNILNETKYYSNCRGKDVIQQTLWKCTKKNSYVKTLTIKNILRSNPKLRKINNQIEQYTPKS